MVAQRVVTDSVTQFRLKKWTFSGGDTSVMANFQFWKCLHFPIMSPSRYFCSRILASKTNLDVATNLAPAIPAKHLYSASDTV
jgi:hypothetical protein